MLSCLPKTVLSVNMHENKTQKENFSILVHRFVIKASTCEIFAATLSNICSSSYDISWGAAHAWLCNDDAHNFRVS
jgi:hypothetical protein